jgi:putative inorganic carbon (hco3(-)) transporter
MTDRSNPLPDKPSRLLWPAAVLIAGIALGWAVLRLENLPIRWFACFSGMMVFILLWPVYGWVTRNPEKLLWIVLFVSIPLDFDVHLVYREYVGTYNGILLNITDLAFFGLAASWLYDFLVFKTQRIHFYPRAVLPAVCLLLVQAASVVNASDVSFAVFSLIQNTKAFFFFLFLVNRLQKVDDFELVWTLLLWCLILESAICTAQFVTRTNYTTAMKTAEDYGQELFRVGGTTGSPNVTGSYIASLLPIPVVALVSKLRARPSWLLWTSAVWGSIALILTQTRGAWISFAAGIILFLLISGRLRHLWRFFLGAGAAGGLLFFIFRKVLIERFSEGLETLIYRLNLMQSAFEMIKSHPLLGIGINNYARVMDDYVPFFLTQERWIVHNHYLLVAAETGLLGFGCFLVLLFILFASIHQAGKSQNRFIAAFSTSVFFSLLIFCFQMMMESLDGRISDSHFWLIAGIGMSLYGWTRSHALPDGPPGREAS